MSESTETHPVPQFGVGSLVKHPTFGRGRIVGYDHGQYVIVFKGEGYRSVPFGYAGLTPEQIAGDPASDTIRQAVREALLDYGWIESEGELGKRWSGGKLILVPGNEATQSREIPLEAFFKKIVGVRDKLRVLEQKINSHPSLSPEEKLEMEGHITRCYGSLTTFNLLFTSKEGHFRGQGKED